MAKRNWAKMDEGWHMNRKVKKVLRRHGPVGGAYWAYLITTSYRHSSYSTNPTGVIPTTVQDIADDLMDPEPRADILRSMVDAKLVRVKGAGWESDPEIDIEIELVDFGQWQVCKGSPARKMLEQRTAEKERDLQAFVTTCEKTVIQNENEIEKEIEKKNNLGRRNDPCIPDSSNQVVRQQSLSQTDTVRNRTIQKPTAEQIDKAITVHRARIGERNSALVDQLVAVLAEGNKTGKVAASRALRTIWQPLGDASDDLSDEAMAYGLSAALAKGAPNANYVKRAAEGYSASSNVVPISSGPQRQRLSSITDEQLDGWI